MSIGGNLRTMPFADLLQWISQSRKTGTLVVDGETYSKRVYFREGTVVAAASDNPKEFLSYYLVGWGYVSEDELQELLDMQERHGTMLGELLVIVGRLTREELDHILQVKTAEAIYDLFIWQEGDFRFLDNILPAKRFQPLSLEVDMLVLEGVRRSDEWMQIRAVIPESSWIPKLVRAVEVKSLGTQELAILREINGKNSVERIALNCRVPEFFAAHFIFQGLKHGLFQLTPPTEKDDAIPGFSQGSWRVLLKTAERLVEQGELMDAWDRASELRTKYGDQPEIAELAGALEKKIEEVLSERNLVNEAIPELAISPQELPKLSCTPEEGFVLSRVNGLYTLGEVLQLLPGTQMEKRLLVDSLVKRGVLKLRPPEEEGSQAG